MDGNDIIIRVQFLLSTSGEEATNYLMSRGCVRLPITEPEKKNWRNKRRPTTHKFNARWCSRLETKHNLSGAHHYPVLSLSARTILPSGISFAAFAGETFFSRIFSSFTLRSRFAVASTYLCCVDCEPARNRRPWGPWLAVLCAHRGPGDNPSPRRTPTLKPSRGASCYFRLKFWLHFASPRAWLQQLFGSLMTAYHFQ